MVQLIIGCFSVVMIGFVLYIALKSPKKGDFEGKTKESGLEDKKPDEKKPHER